MLTEHKMTFDQWKSHNKKVLKEQTEESVKQQYEQYLKSFDVVK